MQILVKMLKKPVMMSQRLIESNEMRVMVFTLAAEAKERGKKTLGSKKRLSKYIESRELVVLC